MRLAKLLAICPVTLLAQLPPLTPSRVVRRVEPSYSAEARAAGLQGTVSLYVEVGREGKAADVEVMQGLGLGLDEEAIKAVRQWDFQPKPGGGEIQDALEVVMRFQLDPPSPWFVESETYAYTPPVRTPLAEFVRPVPTRFMAPDPAACQEAGTVTVHFDVGKDGKPGNPQPEQPASSTLTDAAVKAVGSWHFQPGEYNGKKVGSHATAVLSCRLAGALTHADPTPTYRVGGAVNAPVLISKVEPGYSELARKSQLQGDVVLTLRISPDGKATAIHVKQMLGMGLDRNAIEAVKTWRFKPGTKGGEPVTVEATIQVNFRLL